VFFAKELSAAFSTLQTTWNSLPTYRSIIWSYSDCKYLALKSKCSLSYVLSTGMTFVFSICSDMGRMRDKVKYGFFMSLRSTFSLTLSRLGFLNFSIGL